MDGDDGCLVVMRCRETPASDVVYTRRRSMKLNVAGDSPNEEVHNRDVSFTRKLVMRIPAGAF